MHVTGWDIDGFGLLGPHRVEQLPDGLVIVTGPNEAGKSTLVTFLRAVLFGFGDDAITTGRYRPVRGGHWGGTVALETTRGPMTVTRHAEPGDLSVRAGDGGELRPEALDIVFGEIDASVFDSVLTLAAPDLDAFAGLEVDEVRERLLSAGSSGSARRARAALIELESERAAIWSPDGGGVINQLRDELRDATGRLTEVRRESANHEQHALEVTRRAEETDRLAGELDEARRAVARYRTILEVWDDYREGRDARAELDTLGEPAPLDDDTQVRFERLIAEVEAAERTEREERARLERAQERAATISVDAALSELTEPVRRLHAELAAETMRAERTDELSRSRRSQETELDDELAALGPDWDRDRLQSFTTSMPAAEEIRGWARRIDEQQERARELDDERAAAEVDEREAAQEADRARQALGRFLGVPASADIETAYTTVRRLRAAIAELDRQRSEVHSAENTLAVLETARRRALDQPELTGLARWLQPLLLTTAVLLIMAAGGALFAQQNLAATIAGLTAVVVAGLAFVAPTRPAPPDPKRAGPERIAAAEEALAARRDEAEHLQLVVTGLAAQLQLPDPPSPADIDSRERDIIDYRDARREAERLAEHRAELIDRQRLAAQRRTRLAERAGEVRAETERVRAEWVAWKAERRIPVELDPEGVGELFAAVRRARAAARRLELLEAEVEANGAKRHDFADRARELLARAGATGATDGGPAAVAATDDGSDATGATDGGAIDGGASDGGAA
ncbi:MAG: AAA family ATPase, partial [Actinomycetota bacterium]|nr:AAA family ATPase [Actinomycetota bacterium]